MANENIFNSLINKHTNDYFDMTQKNPKASTIPQPNYMKIKNNTACYTKSALKGYEEYIPISAFQFMYGSSSSDFSSNECQNSNAAQVGQVIAHIRNHDPVAHHLLNIITGINHIPAGGIEFVNMSANNISKEPRLKVILGETSIQTIRFTGSNKGTADKMEGISILFKPTSFTIEFHNTDRGVTSGHISLFGSGTETTAEPKD